MRNKIRRVVDNLDEAFNMISNEELTHNEEIMDKIESVSEYFENEFKKVEKNGRSN